MGQNDAIPPGTKRQWPEVARHCTVESSEKPLCYSRAVIPNTRRSNSLITARGRPCGSSSSSRPLRRRASLADPRLRNRSPARSRRSRTPARSRWVIATRRSVLVLRRQAAGHRLRDGHLHEDRRRGEGRAQAAEAQGEAQPGHLGHAHSADGERHDRPRMRIDHQQSRSSEAGELHHHPFRHRQPFRFEKVGEHQDARRSQGQDHRLDLGHHQHQADHRGQRARRISA